MDDVRALDDEQVEDFDTEFVSDNGFEYLTDCIRKMHGDAEFTFLDLGGGNGNFTDRLLEAFPAAIGYVLDNSEYLLEKNQPHPRKHLVLASADHIQEVFPDTKFDIIFANWVLHHLIYDSYRSTTKNLQETLTNLQGVLKDGAKISVFENLYDGWLFDNLPSHVIYHLTSSRLLAPLTKMGGANTAGVGVCFRSKKSWLSSFENAHLKNTGFWEDDWKFDVSLINRLVLHMGNVRTGHFWLGN